MNITTWGDRSWWSAADCIHVDREVERRGAGHQDILDWVATARTVKSWAIRHRVITQWPPCFVYCTMAEAIMHHVREPYANLMMRANEPVVIRCMSGAALFDSHSDVARPDSPRTGDRTLLAVSAMGGDHPLLDTLLHELGHHHLWQVHRTPQSRQISTSTELAVDRLVDGWSSTLRGMVPRSNSAIFRLIDIASPGDT